MGNLNKTFKPIIFNGIPKQNLYNANQLTIQSWNRIINSLSEQGNNNANEIQDLRNILFGKDNDGTNKINIDWYDNNSILTSIKVQIENAKAYTEQVAATKVDKTAHDDLANTVSGHTTSITNLQSNVATNTSDISLLKSSTSKLQSDVSANSSAITQANQDIAERVKNYGNDKKVIVKGSTDKTNGTGIICDYGTQKVSVFGGTLEVEKDMFVTDGIGFTDTGAKETRKNLNVYSQDYIDKQLVEADDTTTGFMTATAHKKLTDATADILANTNNISSLSEQLDALRTVVQNRSTGYVFENKADLDNWIAIPDNKALLVNGDVLLLRAVNEPDYWWDATKNEYYILETKIDLSAFMKIDDFDWRLRDEVLKLKFSDLNVETIEMRSEEVEFIDMEEIAASKLFGRKFRMINHIPEANLVKSRDLFIEFNDGESFIIDHALQSGSRNPDAYGLFYHIAEDNLPEDVMEINYMYANEALADEINSRYAEPFLTPHQWIKDVVINEIIYEDPDNIHTVREPVDHFSKCYSPVFNLENLTSALEGYSGNLTTLEAFLKPYDTSVVPNPETTDETPTLESIGIDGANYKLISQQELDKKIGKSNVINTVYAVDYDGSQVSRSFSVNPNPYTFVYRDNNGCTKVATPTDDAHAVTKKYVDDALANVGGGGYVHKINGQMGDYVIYSSNPNKFTYDEICEYARTNKIIAINYGGSPMIKFNILLYGYLNGVMTLQDIWVRPDGSSGDTTTYTRDYWTSYIMTDRYTVTPL